MARFKFRKEIEIGKLAAENDELLKDAFIDQGFLAKLVDCSSPEFLILGRTGSGKTALLKEIKRRNQKVCNIDPEELSMQYLQNSTVLKGVAALGVSLEGFYRYLWRHVCILALIRMRYGDADDVPSKIAQLLPLGKLFNCEKAKAKDISQDYLRQYGDDYWVKTDTRIKGITTEIEEKLTGDASVSAALGMAGNKLSANMGSGNSTRLNEKVEREVIDRAQSIVSDFQIAALNRVVELLEKHSFNDPLQHYYVVIDDLDKDWMPDDKLYLTLIKSLLFTVYELNRKLAGAKIIVALRENIYHRVFRKAAQHEPQREKWADVLVPLRWTKKELENIVDTRLSVVLRREYTKGAPTLREILPADKRTENALDFVLERTLLRPRDIIGLVNIYLKRVADSNKQTWSTLFASEREYSEGRLKSVFDEWKDSYFGLTTCFPILRKVGPRFSAEDIIESDVEKVLNDPKCDSCEWLRGLQEGFMTSKLTLAQVRTELIKALYLVGLIGIKDPHSHQTYYSYERPFEVVPEIESRATFHVHRMFWTALGLAGQRAISQAAS